MLSKNKFEDKHLLGLHYSKNSNQQPVKKKFASNKELPVCRYKETFLKLLSENHAIVLIGETGSGKTTQIPQWCLEYSLKIDNKLSVGCTQPRRIAAMSVSSRVAKEMDVILGEDVGYSVRFESCCSTRTRLKYMTDGMLLREAMLDGMLSSYAVILLDEAHERTLQTEILFGVVKRAMIARNNTNTNISKLKVIIMSATINAKPFRKYFNSPSLLIEGRQYPVQDMFATSPQSDLLTSTLITVFQVHRTSQEGDILVFCSGQDEINSLITLCKRTLKHAPDTLKNLKPLPLYASLPVGHQMKVFEHGGDRKMNGTNGSSDDDTSSYRRVIFATNVAETSVTIPNIKYVIDTGKVKCRTYCPKTGLESLKVISISKAQAGQRSGRAGRTAPGTCYRLYTDVDYSSMDDHPIPEIKRCNLDGVMLQMISIGINNIGNFEFFDKPDEARIKNALSNLVSLKAIKIISDKKTESNSSPKKSSHLAINEDLLNLNYEMTKLGKKLCVFPLSPSMSRIIIAAHELSCLEEAITIIAFLYVENIFHIPANKQSQADNILGKFKSNEGDTIMLLKVFRAFKRKSKLDRVGLKQWCNEHFINTKNLTLARMIRKQLVDLCKSQGMSLTSCGQDTSLVRQAFTYGLFNNVATMFNGKYRNKTCNDIYIHPSSCLFNSRPECLLYVEILETNKCYMRNCTVIDMNWIREISSANMNSKNQ